MHARFLGFLALGLLVVFVQLTFAGLIPGPARVPVQLGLIVALLAVSLQLRRSPRLARYWRVSFAYCIAAIALFASEYVGDWGLLLSGLALDSPGGLAALKLSEDIAIVLCIVLLTLLSGDRSGAIFLQRGNLRLGLGIGLGSLLLCSLLAALQLAAEGPGGAVLRSLAPAAAVIVLADGFMEELLFRGLFLKKLEPVLGGAGANVVTAAVFSLAHLQATFTAALPLLLLATFLLGLLWGWIMRRTDSVIGPALFHAAVDVLIIRDFFVAYGAGS